jgi:rSAM/selenodomain-associated transferase 2
MATGASIAVIIPTLNEAEELRTTIGLARARGAGYVIVADGGSSDATLEVADQIADLAISAPRGRAVQMNSGARRARSAEVLLFLHADTHLPRRFREPVEAAIASGAVGGRFDVELRGAHWLLPLIGGLINLRSRWSGIATGDQAMFVRRDVFEALGGFAEIPLMEDVELSRRLRKLGPVAALRERASTSARRWEGAGVARTILLMWWLRLAFACGVSPERLARSYRAQR